MSVSSRQIVGGIMAVGGFGLAVMLLWGTRACEVNTAGVTLALGIAVIGGLVFDSDTFLKAIRAWKGHNDDNGGV